MTAIKKEMITVSASINAPVEKVWDLWTSPVHIICWNNASDDWHTPYAENDLKVGGKFLSRMEARDGSSGFDFNGEYLNIEYLKYIAYVIEGGRKVQIVFVSKGKVTNVTETFETEEINSLELQRAGWQSIMDNFKKYVENQTK